MLERYVGFIIRHRLAVVVATALLTLWFGSQLRHLRLQIDRRAQLPAEHPYVKVHYRIADLFGGDAAVIIGIVANHGTIFTTELLGKVYRITEALCDLDGIAPANVFGIAAPSVKAVSARGEQVDIERVLDHSPARGEDLGEIRDRIQSDPVLREVLVSNDETATLIVADFDTDQLDPEIAGNVHRIVDREKDESVTIALAGAPILRAALADYTAMIRWLFPIAVAIIGLIHYEAFRTTQAMILPLLTALLSVIWSLGIMGSLSLPMDTWSAMTPILILAVAAGHAVQILKRYYEECAHIGDAQLAVVQAIVQVGPVMLTAGAIAAAGFGSLATFRVASVQTFGLLLAFGILSTLVIEMTFIPACRSLLPSPDVREIGRERESRWLDHFLGAIAALVIVRPLRFIVAALFMVLAFGSGIAFLQVDNSFRSWFPDSTKVRRDDEILNSKLAGTATLRVLIEGEEEGILADPAVLRAVDDLQGYLASNSEVGGVMSITNYIKRINQALNSGAADAYAIPDEKSLIQKYLALYAISGGPDGLSAFVDGEYRNAVIRAYTKSDGAQFSSDLINRLREFASRRFLHLPVALGIAGGTLGVQTAMNEVVVHDKILNIIQIAIIIFLLSAVVLRSLTGAAFVLIPLVIAVTVNLGIMGWSGMSLDMATAAITAMGVGIGADFAIYLTFRIREERIHCDTLEEAVRVTLLTSGKAILFVSSAVAAGYLILPLSGFSIWIRLGLLTASIVSLSALATLTVLPALALLLNPEFLRAETLIENVAIGE